MLEFFGAKAGQGPFKRIFSWRKHQGNRSKSFQKYWLDKEPQKHHIFQSRKDPKCFFRTVHAFSQSGGTGSALWSWVTRKATFMPSERQQPPQICDLRESGKCWFQRLTSVKGPVGELWLVLWWDVYFFEAVRCGSRGMKPTVFFQRGPKENNTDPARCEYNPQGWTVTCSAVFSGFAVLGRIFPMLHLQALLLVSARPVHEDFCVVAFDEAPCLAQQVPRFPRHGRKPSWKETRSSNPSFLSVMWVWWGGLTNPRTLQWMLKKTGNYKNISWPHLVHHGRFFTTFVDRKLSDVDCLVWVVGRLIPQKLLVKNKMASSSPPPPPGFWCCQPLAFPSTSFEAHKNPSRRTHRTERTEPHSPRSTSPCSMTLLHQDVKCLSQIVFKYSNDSKYDFKFVFLWPWLVAFKPSEWLSDHLTFAPFAIKHPNAAGWNHGIDPPTPLRGEVCGKMEDGWAKHVQHVVWWSHLKWIIMHFA